MEGLHLSTRCGVYRHQHQEAGLEGHWVDRAGDQQINAAGKAHGAPHTMVPCTSTYSLSQPNSTHQARSDVQDSLEMDQSYSRAHAP
ncbi:hypothetical protein HaLaN_19850, partial [Haematococcus lacustris]